MALISDNFAQNKITFNGSGTREVIRFDPGENSYGRVTLSFEATKAGSKVVRTETRSFSRDANGATLGAASALDSLLDGLLGGVTLDASVDDGSIVLSVDVDPLDAGAWVVDGHILVDGAVKI